MWRYTNSRNLHLHRCPTYRTYLAVDNEMLPAFAHLESKRIILILALSPILLIANVPRWSERVSRLVKTVIRVNIDS
jgi:hypothetical protein